MHEFVFAKFEGVSNKIWNVHVGLYSNPELKWLTIPQVLRLGLN
jgi:hypothetical protein